MQRIEVGGSGYLSHGLMLSEAILSTGGAERSV